MDEGAVTGVVVVGMVVVTLVPLLFIAGVVVLVLLMRTKAAPLPADPEATVTFHARMMRLSSNPISLRHVDPKHNGSLTVTPSEIIWRSDAGDTWTVPIPAVMVTGTTSAFGIFGGSVKVEIGGSGAWRMWVSDKPINKFMRNTAKEFREADAAKKLTGLLLARGARDGSARVA